MQATWIWCIAKIIAEEPQYWPSAVQIRAISATFRPMPPYCSGTYALRSCASLRASKVSCGKRAWRSTSAACAAATSRPMAWTCCSRRSQGAAVAGETQSLDIESTPQFGDGFGDRFQSHKGPTAELGVGELDIEVILEHQHEIHGRQRGQTGEVEVAVVR